MATRYPFSIDGQWRDATGVGTSGAMTEAGHMALAETAGNRKVIPLDQKVPFDGCNHSGFGRVRGEAGILEFTRTETPSPPFRATSAIPFR